MGAVQHTREEGCVCVWVGCELGNEGRGGERLWRERATMEIMAQRRREG